MRVPGLGDALGPPHWHASEQWGRAAPREDRPHASDASGVLPRVGRLADPEFLELVSVRSHLHRSKLRLPRRGAPAFANPRLPHSSASHSARGWAMPDAMSVRWTRPITATIEKIPRQPNVHVFLGPMHGPFAVRT